jgi:hypothetical protein
MKKIRRNKLPVDIIEEGMTAAGCVVNSTMGIENAYNLLSKNGLYVHTMELYESIGGDERLDIDKSILGLDSASREHQIDPYGLLKDKIDKINDSKISIAYIIIWLAPNDWP